MSDKEVKITYADLYKILQKDGLLNNLLSSYIFQHCLRYATPDELTEAELEKPVTITILERTLVDPPQVTFPASHYVQQVADMIPKVYKHTGESTFDLYEGALEYVGKRLLAIGAIHFLD